MIMQELSETSNKHMTTCDQYVPDNAAVELWQRSPHAHASSAPPRRTGKGTGTHRPTFNTQLSSWTFILRSHSKAGTTGIPHPNAWNIRQRIHMNMLKWARSSREKTAEGRTFLLLKGYTFQQIWLTTAILAQRLIKSLTGVRSSPQTNMAAKTCSACKQECTEYTRFPPLSWSPRSIAHLQRTHRSNVPGYVTASMRGIIRTCTYGFQNSRSGAG